VFDGNHKIMEFALKCPIFMKETQISTKSHHEAETNWRKETKINVIHPPVASGVILR
jgi:hypothetical protein